MRTVVFMAAAAVACAACGKSGEQQQGAMKKVETKAEGLPAASQAPVRESPQAAAPSPHGAGMPMDEAHRGLAGQAGDTEGHGAVAEPAETDGNALPLRKGGLGSAEELARALARVQGDEAKRDFESAFRLTFTADKSRRDPGRAADLLDGLLKNQPGLAEAYRCLAYAALSRDFNVAKAAEHYQKAIELRPDYGEVHYALAFLYSGSDRAKGTEHLRKALELKVPDEQGLRKLYGM